MDQRPDRPSGPLQRIEVDLAAPSTVTRIELNVAQFPAGTTDHLLVAFVGGSWEPIKEFNEATAQGDWLVYMPPSPLAGYQQFRVETAASPSDVAWTEIRIIGQP